MDSDTESGCEEAAEKVADDGRGEFADAEKSTKGRVQVGQDGAGEAVP